MRVRTRTKRATSAASTPAASAAARSSLGLKRAGSETIVACRPLPDKRVVFGLAICWLFFVIWNFYVKFQVEVPVVPRLSPHEVPAEVAREVAA